ncbi:bifunctional folylpolyglutamate synthase/dihydrofolate synthase [Paludibaculum fermentans]|uniref:Dihydrofolate synthase/folylpolyglutamate synthase n=1 Tax=Paludibaculum fermentans TaxID=1473598 RepID=A0A7S7NYJ3_PALFE|nr:bifunctional folylpolyglutamate synthase/dihydrofolate synthase [Paludibaculum fermentans]
MYPDSVRFLYALGNEYKTIKLGLERITAILEALGSPHRAGRFIHVAGTNGKGSTCAMLERAVRESGVRTGLYTSPHLVEPTERIRVNGVPATQQEFAAAFTEVHETAERLLRDGAIDMHPTYFETVTAMAFLHFRNAGAEVTILETGMGGRLDATNVVDPLLSVITPVDFDHEKFLGNTIPQIAFEKAGIIKPRRPVVVSRQHPEAMQVLEQRAAEVGAPLLRASEWRVDHMALHAYGSRFHAARSGRGVEVECPLIGAHQVENALTAVSALDQLGYTPAQIQRGLAETVWPGRLERVRQQPDLFLDGAHNPAGARALAGYLRHFHHGKRVWMVFGAMRDKDLHVIGPMLFPLASELIFTTPNQARAFQAEEIREISGESRARVAPSPKDALALLDAAAPQDVLLLTGSLYLVGEVRGLLMG